MARLALGLACAIGIPISADAQQAVNPGFDHPFVPLPNIGWLGKGYDILKGNPRPSGDTSMADPGWRSAIFRRDFSNQETTAFSGSVYGVPNGVEAASCAACSFDFTSSELMSARDYQESLRVKVDAEFGGWGASFKASADYKSVEERHQRKKSSFMESGGECEVYCANLAPYALPPVSESFNVAVETILPPFFDSSVYFQFIRDFGTHYVQAVRMGASYSVLHEITEENVEALVEQSINIQVAASASALGFRGGASFLGEEEKSQATAFSSATRSQKELTIGGAPITSTDGTRDTALWFEEALQNPLPVAYKLEQISTLLNDRVFPNSNSTEIELKRAFLDQALTSYCAQLQTEGLIECGQGEVAKFGDLPLVAISASTSTPDEAQDPFEYSYDIQNDWLDHGQPEITELKVYSTVESLSAAQGSTPIRKVIAGIHATFEDGLTFGSCSAPVIFSDATSSANLTSGPTSLLLDGRINGGGRIEFTTYPNDLTLRVSGESPQDLCTVAFIAQNNDRPTTFEVFTSIDNENFVSHGTFEGKPYLNIVPITATPAQFLRIRVFGSNSAKVDIREIYAYATENGERDGSEATPSFDANGHVYTTTAQSFELAPGERITSVDVCTETSIFIPAFRLSTTSGRQAFFGEENKARCIKSFFFEEGISFIGAQASTWPEFFVSGLTGSDFFRGDILAGITDLGLFEPLTRNSQENHCRREESTILPSFCNE